MNVHEIFFPQIVLQQKTENIVKNNFVNDYENDLKSLNFSDDFDFQVIDMSF